MESPPFTLGRKHMKLRSALLLGGVALITAIPVCADSIFYSAPINEPSNSESFAPTIGISHTKFITPFTVQFISEPIISDAQSWASLIIGSEINCTVNGVINFVWEMPIVGAKLSEFEGSFMGAE